MIQCNRSHLQYIGETRRRLKDRFNEHRRAIDNPNSISKPTTVAERFLYAPNHTANDMQWNFFLAGLSPLGQGSLFNLKRHNN